MSSNKKTTDLDALLKGTSAAPKAAAPRVNNDKLPFTAWNYKLMGVSVAIIALGFILLTTEGYKDATEFSISLHVVPVVLLAGFGFMIYAIMAKPKGGQA